MTNWTDDDRERIGSARELRIATKRTDGTARSFVPIWVVRVGDDLFVRAYHGPTGSWFRQARRSGRALIRAGGIEREVTFADVDKTPRSAVDAAYRAKYGRGMYVDAMITDAAAAATLRLERI